MLRLHLLVIQDEENGTHIEFLRSEITHETMRHHVATPEHSRSYPLHTSDITQPVQTSTIVPTSTAIETVRPTLRAPYTEPFRPHALDMSASLRPSLLEMPRSHVETRDHLIETTSSSETVLFVIGHVRGFLRYTDIHGHIYGKWKDPNGREIQHC